MPVIHKCEPRSAEWFALRLGIPTASEFHRILTPKTLKVSSQAPAYMHRLLGEWITGEQVENYQSEFMVRGQELEDQAISAFELLTDIETSPGNFISTDDGWLGCSPDRLIGDDSDLEIKCPLIQGAVGYALNGLSEEHVCQVQGRLMIEERDSVYVFAYHPRLSIPPLRVSRDERFIAIMRPVLQQFVETMLACRVSLEQRFGPFPRPQPEARPNADELGVSDEDVDAIIAAQVSV